VDSIETAGSDFKLLLKRTILPSQTWEFDGS